MADNKSDTISSIIDNEVIIKRLKINELLKEQFGLYESNYDEQKKIKELQEKEVEILDNRLTTMKEVAGSKKRMLEYHEKEKGLFNSIFSIQTKSLDQIKKHAEANKTVNNHVQVLKVLKKKLQDDEVIANVELSKGLRKEIRDETHLLSLQKIKNHGLAEGNVLNTKLANLMAKMGGFSFFTVLGKSLLALFTGLKSLIGGIFNTIKSVFTGAYDLWMKLQTLTGNITADMGQSVLQTQMIRDNIGKIGIAATMWGIKIEEALGFMTDFSDITGLTHVLLADQIEDLSAIAKATGLGVGDTGKMYANMELLGYSTKSFRGYVEDTRQSSATLGLNITKVLTTVKLLLPAYNALNFKDGVAGLTEIVKKAQGLRFTLDNMRDLSVKIFNPEGAVELAAKLRVLGGSFAQMADPFSLMLKAQTDAAGLMDDVINSVSGLAIKGKDGLFSIPPVQQALLREFAAATGENVDNLVKATIQSAKQNEIMSQLRSGGIFKKEDLEAVANLAEYDSDKKQYTVKIDASGTRKAVSELNQSMVKQLRGVARDEQEVATSRMNIIDQLKGMYDMFLFSLQPIFRPIEALLRDSGFLGALRRTMADLSTFIANKLIPIFSSGSGVYGWMYKLGKTLKGIVESIATTLNGGGDLFAVLGKAAAFLAVNMWKAIAPEIRKLLAPVKEGASSAAGWAGAAGGAMLGAQLGTMFLPGWGTAIGGVLGGVGGYIGASKGMDSFMGGSSSVANDAIIRGDGTVQHFNKDDLVAVGTNLDARNKGADMIPAKDIMKQSMDYTKDKYEPLNMSGGGGNNTPQTVKFDISGTLEIKGEKNSAYLTSADLKNVGLQRLTALILNETDRYRNHGSGKKLSNEIITPINSA